MTARVRATLLHGYAAQAYASLAALAFAPWILSRIGAEAYGLVGVFVIAQAWFQLLDAGLTPTLARESARHAAGALDAASLGATVRALDALVIGVSVVVLIAIAASADALAGRWLRHDTLDVGEIATVLVLGAAILVVRWVGGVRRGLLTGFERHATLHNLQMLVATLRFPCIAPWFAVAGTSASAYFVWQLAITVLESVLLHRLSRDLVPPGHDAAGVRRRALERIAPFAANHALLALLWILITQTDKLILSALLPLAEFGRFSLAVAAAAGVNLIVLPINQVLLPRLARLSAAGDERALVALYVRATAATVVLIGSVAVLFALFADALMLAWTDDAGIARATATALAGYTVGNALMAISVFTYYLQYARGELRWHTVGTALFLVVVTPALVWAVRRHGVDGAALAWPLCWLAYLALWVTCTHRALLPGHAWRWLRDGVLRPLVPAALAGAALERFVTLPGGRLALVASLLGCGAIVLGASLLGSGLIALRTRTPATSLPDVRP